MIALDTNVLVRHLTQDDPVQSPVASREIEQAADRGEEILIADVVLCELVWVLEDCYKLKRDQIAGILERILQTSAFCFQTKEILWAALGDYRAGKADFSDYLIGRTARSAGTQPTLTFDRALRDNPLFRVL